MEPFELLGGGLEEGTHMLRKLQVVDGISKGRNGKIAFKLGDHGFFGVDEIEKFIDVFFLIRCFRNSKALNCQEAPFLGNDKGNSWENGLDSTDVGGGR